MARKKKVITMVVKVSVPLAMTAWAARREVRTLIQHQSNYAAEVEPEDVRVVSVRPPPLSGRLR